MPRVCTICSHEARAEIDAALIQSTPNRRLAPRFGVTESALRRHADSHLVALLARASAADVVRADDLLGDARRTQAETLEILNVAKASGDSRTALVALEGLRRGIVLLGSLAERLASVSGPQRYVFHWASEVIECPRCGWKAHGSEEFWSEKQEQPQPKPVEGSAERARLPANVRPLRPINPVERGPL